MENTLTIGNELAFDFYDDSYTVLPTAEDFDAHEHVFAHLIIPATVFRPMVSNEMWEFINKTLSEGLGKVAK